MDRIKRKEVGLTKRIAVQETRSPMRAKSVEDNSPSPFKLLVNSPPKSAEAQMEASD